MFVLIMKPKAEKQLRKLPRHDQEKVAAAIDRLAEDPFSGKKLEGDLDGYHSVRVWPYRIIYSIEKKIVTVTVVAIGHRKDIYRRLER